MGIYINPNNNNFKRSLNSKLYVDKSKLISFTNRVVNTDDCFVCVSRPRRFGKSMAANMLAAYYGNGEDTRFLFDKLKIKNDVSYEEYLNQFDVIKMDMQSFLNQGETASGLISLLTNRIGKELRKLYSGVEFDKPEYLPDMLNMVLASTGRQFVIIIDEWDCVMRRIHEWEEQKIYLDFLRDLLKDQPYVALAYMTGILPIKKYGEHSTLNMFREYSMIESAEISDCFGFTEDEVQELCHQFGGNFDALKEWYDGYHLISEVHFNRKEYSIYSPNSIVEVFSRGKYDDYWNQTETYEALQCHIQGNMDGLKDAVIEMLAGASVSVDTSTFKNDMFSPVTRDEALTLLVHLGYLTYNQDYKTVSIPNKEVAKEFERSIRNSEVYKEVADSLNASSKLLQALWNGDCEAVSAGIDAAHKNFSSIHYHNENALSCVIELAFYYARDYYTIIRELPTGNGFADICYLPKPNVDKPAMIIELKWNHSADTALEQIKQKDYPDKLKIYHGNLLLCGISYNKDSQKHTCLIERFAK